MRILMLCNAKSVHGRRWALALAGRGHAVTVASIRHAELPGVTVRTFPRGGTEAGGLARPALGYVQMAIGLRGLVRELQPDVVNPHYCVTHGTIAALAGATPRVVNIWGSDVDHDGPGSMPAWRRHLVRLGIEGAARLVSTSQFMLDRTLPLLKRAPSATLVPFGVDCDRFRPVDRAGRERVTVGWVKTFKPVYAPEIFLRAIAIAARDRPWLDIVMAGRGPDLEAARTQAEELGLTEQITFPGFVPNDEVPALMQSFDILVNSSRRESFGVVLLEAGASGLPTVACDVGGVREAMVEGETGLLVPRDDAGALAAAIGRLADDAILRARMGMAGRAFVAREYPWERCVDLQEAALAKAAGLA